MRVVVLGAGYAGLSLARRLERSLPESVELVLVDESGTHLVQHELHRVVRRPSLAEGIELPLSELLDRTELIEAGVMAVDTDEQAIILDESGTESELSYELGAVCLGARTAFYGLAGVREHATPLKRIADALAIREEFLEVTREDDEGRVVVGGAGLSGVQVAGELAALAREQGVAPEIVLLEREETVAPRFPGQFQRVVRDTLEASGVEVRTDCRVVGGDSGTVELADGSAVEYDQLVWTGGIRGSKALRDERPVVRADLRLVEGTFGLGDAVRVVDEDGEAVPASAQAAVRQAKVAAENISRLIEGGDGVFEPRLARYSFESPGWIVSVGDDAVAQVGRSVLTGAPARALKATVGASYLTSVGAVANAADVVYEELGLAGEDVPDDVEWPDRGP